MTIISSIISVFEEISAWIVNSVESIVPMFYNSTDGLTFLGTLAVSGLAMSVFFLVMGIIQRFLHFRG